MFLRQVYEPALAHYSYLIGCQRTGEAIVIDPLRDIDRYHELAADNDLRITAAADTHIHADYLTGAREFGADPDVTLYLSGEGGEDWQYEWAEDLPNVTLVRDGDTFRTGGIELQVTATPGHTPEHITFTVTDLGAGAETPIGICSGDFVFVGDVGRPDLLESAAGQTGAMEPSARKLFESLRAFGSTADEIQVWPAHGAGSPCGKALGAVPTSTAGYEKRYNAAYQMSGQGQDAFVDFILADQPEPPTYWARMKMQNRGGFPVLGTLPTPGRMNPAELAAALDDAETVVVDTRNDRAAFMSEHLRHSIFAPAGDTFPIILGSYVEPGRKIVLLVENTHRLRELIRMAIRIGLDDIVGYALAEEAVSSPELADSLASIRRLPTNEMLGLIAKEPEHQVLDVRGAKEHRLGNVEGATNIAHTRLSARLDDLPEGKLALHCASGGRAASAASYLAHLGREVVHIDGPYGEIQEAEVEAPRDA